MVTKGRIRVRKGLTFCEFVSGEVRYLCSVIEPRIKSCVLMFFTLVVVHIHLIVSKYLAITLCVGFVELLHSYLLHTCLKRLKNTLHFIISHQSLS